MRCVECGTTTYNTLVMRLRVKFEFLEKDKLLKLPICNDCTYQVKNSRYSYLDIAFYSLDEGEDGDY